MKGFRRGAITVDQRHSFVEINPFTWRRLYIHEEAGAVAHGNHDDVGGTGGESLLPLLDRGDPDNLDIGHGDQHQRAEQCHQSQGKIHHLQHLWPTADHLHQRRIVTEEVVDVGVTEWKLTGEDEGNEDEGEACQPAGEDELRADSAAHEAGVAEGPADGDVPVVGHGCEEEELCGPQEDVEKVLGDAASKANGLSSSGNVEKHLGHDDSLEPNFQAGQIPEEEVHRGLQEGVQQGQADDGQRQSQGRQAAGAGKLPPEALLRLSALGGRTQSPRSDWPLWISGPFQKRASLGR